MYVFRKAIKKLILDSVFLFVVLTIMFSGIICPESIKVNAANSFIISGDYYYIKNVNSGKYLTVEHSSTSNGTKIIQLHYTGGTNQKWKINRINNGNYNGYFKIATALNTNKVIEIESAQTENGLFAQLYTDTYGRVQQYYSIELLANMASRIYTNASNFIDVLTMNGASVYDNAKLLQYQVNYNANNLELLYSSVANDQWLIEPADYYNSTYSKAYAQCNYNRHLRTYPDLDLIGGNCANFVSQCLVNGGYRYQNEWYVNKKNNNYLKPANSSQLDNTWYLNDPSPWISAQRFYLFWDTCNQTATYTIEDIINNSNTGSTINFTTGDVVQIMKSNGFLLEAKHTMLIVQPHSSDKGSYLVTYQSNNTISRALRDICIDYKNASNNNYQYYLKFYDFT